MGRPVVRLGEPHRAIDGGMVGDREIEDLGRRGGEERHELGLGGGQPALQSMAERPADLAVAPEGRDRDGPGQGGVRRRQRLGADRLRQRLVEGGRALLADQRRDRLLRGPPGAEARRVGARPLR